MNNELTEVIDFIESATIEERNLLVRNLRTEADKSCEEEFEEFEEY